MSNAAVFLVIFAGTAFLAVLTDRIRFFARHELLTGVALVGVALAAIAVRLGYAAMELSDSALQAEVESVETDIDDQLGFALQCGAETIIGYLGGQGELTRERMSEAAKLFGLDEINMVDAHGTIVASNVRRTGVPFDGGSARAKYAELLKGTRTYVKCRFRDSEDENVKHFGIAMPKGGFLQLGYYWSSFERDFYRYFIQMFEERHVGDTGFYLVVDDKGRIGLSVADHPEANGRSLAEIGLRPEDLYRPAEDKFLARVFGRWCLCESYVPIGQWRCFAVLPIADIAFPAMRIAGFAAIILVIFCVIFRLALVRLRRAQSKIDALRADEESRHAADMALARAIQRAELRTDGTQGDGYRLASLMNAAREVGGDFYDYYTLPDGRLVVTIADVSGKGIPAAFFMMKARTTLKACIFEASSLADAVAKANVRLARNNPAEMFVTAWVGIFDRMTGEIEFVSAGHNPPLVRRPRPSDRPSVEWLQAPRSAALGVFETAHYRSVRTALAPGDRLFLYTDGVNEAMNPGGELFGNERLMATLAQTDGPLIPAVRSAVHDFANGAEQADDITMLVLEITEVRT